MSILTEIQDIVRDVYLAIPAGIAGTVYGLAEMKRKASADPDDHGPRFTPHGVYARPWVRRWMIAAVVILIAGHIFLRASSHEFGRWIDRLHKIQSN